MSIAQGVLGGSSIVVAVVLGLAALGNTVLSPIGLGFSLVILVLGICGIAFSNDLGAKIYRKEAQLSGRSSANAATVPTSKVRPMSNPQAPASATKAAETPRRIESAGETSAELNGKGSEQNSNDDTNVMILQEVDEVEHDFRKVSDEVHSTGAVAAAVDGDPRNALEQNRSDTASSAEATVGASTSDLSVENPQAQRKRDVIIGLICAILVGFFGGSILFPLGFAAPESVSPRISACTPDIPLPLGHFFLMTCYNLHVASTGRNRVRSFSRYRCRHFCANRGCT